MLSDVTITFADHAVSFPGLYLLIGLLLIVGISGFLVAWNSARRMERKVSETTDLLAVQLERIGEALERIITQNATRPVSEAPAKQRTERSPLEWAVPGRVFPPRVIPEGSGLERIAQHKGVPEPLPPPVRVAPPSIPVVAAPPVPAQAQASAEEPSLDKKPEEQPVESTLSEPARSILFSMLGR